MRVLLTRIGDNGRLVDGNWDPSHIGLPYSVLIVAAVRPKPQRVQVRVAKPIEVCQR